MRYARDQKLLLLFEECVGNFTNKGADFIKVRNKLSPDLRPMIYLKETRNGSVFSERILSRHGVAANASSV